MSGQFVFPSSRGFSIFQRVLVLFLGLGMACRLIIVRGLLSCFFLGFLAFLRPCQRQTRCGRCCLRFWTLLRVLFFLLQRCFLSVFRHSIPHLCRECSRFSILFRWERLLGRCSCRIFFLLRFLT